MRTPIGADRPNPSPPIAALRKPSGRRAGMRACSSGRLDGDSSTSTTSSGSRSARAASTCPARSGSPGPGGAGGSGRAEPGGAPTRALGQPARASSAHTAAGSASSDQLGRAAVRLGRVVGHERDPRARRSTNGPGS